MLSLLISPQRHAPQKRSCYPNLGPGPKKKKAELTRTVPLSHYREAVQQHFNCAPSDFEFAVCWENGPCQIKMGENVYRVDSTHDITEHAKLMLTEAEMAMDFPTEWAFLVLEGVHREGEFYHHLLHSIGHDALKLTQLQTVLAVTRSTGDGIETFWRCLRAVDDMELYPAAILAAAKTYDFNSLVEDIFEYLTGESNHYLNQLIGGIFETVVLNDAGFDDPTPEDLQKEEYFYIYSVDDACWNEEEVVVF